MLDVVFTVVALKRQGLKEDLGINIVVIDDHVYIGEDRQRVIVLRTVTQSTPI